MALVLVIWVLAVLAVLLSEYVRSSRVGLEGVRNQKRDAAGYYLALAGIARGMGEIREEFIRVEAGDEAAGVRFVRRELEADESADEDSTERAGEIAGVGKYSYRIIDEESKININTFSREWLARFLRAAGVELGEDRDVLLDSIVDWRDPNELHQLNGAESDYYQTLDPPYHSKNGRFDTAAELLLVKGMTRERFYTSKETDGPALADMVSVHAVKCNFNTAPQPVLVGWLGEAQARDLLAKRPVKGDAGTSSFFTLEAEGTPVGGGAGRKIRVVVRRETTVRGSAKTVELKTLEWDDLPSVRPPVTRAADEN